MSQLRIARVQARVPDHPGQQHHQPDQAKTQEPAQASQGAAGTRSRTGSRWAGQRTSLAGGGAFRPVGDSYDDGVGQQPGDGADWSHGDLPAEAWPWWVQVDSFPARGAPALSPREHHTSCWDVLLGCKPAAATAPTSPSTDSRRRSAWPLCRAYSSIRWHRIHRRLGARPSGQVRRAGCSRPPSASASATRERAGFR